MSENARRNAAPGLRREIITYLVVGVSSTLTDYVLYRVFVLLCGINIDVAKGTSTFICIVLTYCASRIWVFGQKAQDAGSILRFILVYAISLGLNVWINSVVLHMTEAWRPGGVPVGVQVAFLAATAFSACFNFTGMKWFVFRKRG
jgi:putative flippase GtrA